MPGRLVHFEFPVRDADRARTFYAKLFDWEFTPWEGQDEYFMIETEPTGALYPVENGESGPTVYFDVDDIDEAIAQVSELGGRADERQAIPSVGWFARCWDTEGNPFSLFKADADVPAVEIEWEEPQEASYRD